MYGFISDSVQAEGVINLPMKFGEEKISRIQMVDFLVVKQCSAYNAIIGRSKVNALKAVVSTYHLYMKFLIEEAVGIIKGDQVPVRHY